MSSSEEDVHEVEKIIGKRKRKHHTEYLVHWKGYSVKHDSWEPISHLTGCKELIRKFNADLQQEKNSSKRLVSAKESYFKMAKSARVSAFRRRNDFLKNQLYKEEQNKSPLSKKVIYPERATFRKLSIDSRLKMNIPISCSNDAKGSETSDKVLGSSMTGIVAPLPSAIINSNLPQKIFTVNANKLIADKWLKGKEDTRGASVLGDHDYSTSSYRKPLYRPPLTFQSPPSVDGTTSISRKSTLRKGRAFQERLVLLKWRQNFVEIVFANTSRDNALTPRFLVELSNALDAVVSSKCFVVVVNTVGSTFCSGLDVKFLIDTLSNSKFVPDAAKYLAETLRNFVDKLIEFGRILIAIVQGPAVGLGCAMLALFDTVYCSDKAWFWTPYTDMGQTPECCSSALLPEILGRTTANNMLLNGSKLTAKEAKFHGLVTEVFPHDSLKRNAMALIEKTAAKNGEAMVLTKRLMRSASIHHLKNINYIECNELVERWSSQDAIGNLTQFFQSNLDDG